jgi:flagellar protein FliJ
MKATPPWPKLKGVAAQRRDASAQRLAETIKLRDDARKQLATLLDYRAEYEARLATTAGKGIDATALRNYRTFLAQLERALTQQREHLAAAERDMEHATQSWVADHKRTETFQILDDRSLEQASTEARRIEQKQADEWVAQTHNRRGPFRR